MCRLTDSDGMMNTLSRHGSLPKRYNGPRAASDPEAAVDSPKFALRP